MESICGANCPRARLDASMAQASPYSVGRAEAWPRAGGRSRGGHLAAMSVGPPPQSLPTRWGSTPRTAALVWACGPATAAFLNDCAGRQSRSGPALPTRWGWLE